MPVCVCQRRSQSRPFARVDLAVNVLVLAVQIFVTGRMFRWLGLSWTMIALPLVSIAALGMLAVAPVLWVVIGMQVVRRATDFALSKPARELLYTVVSREDRFKGKSVIDLLVYRGGDALAGWGFKACEHARLGVVDRRLGHLSGGLRLGRPGSTPRPSHRRPRSDLGGVSI